MLTPVYHTYADVTMARQYLSGYRSCRGLDLGRTAPAADRGIGVAANGAVHRRAIVGAEDRDARFDIGYGSLRDDALLNDVPPPRRTGPGVLPLDDWLVSATTVTSYHDTARSAESVS